MSWFRLSSFAFVAWGIIFFFFPRFSNQFGGVGYIDSKHAEDWTRLVGLFSMAFAVLLDGAHRSADAGLRRLVARSTLVVTVPSALLLTWWQVIPDRRWIRLDIVDILLLALISYGLFRQSAVGSPRGGRDGTPPKRDVP
jgi:hypothetical protein